MDERNETDSEDNCISRCHTCNRTIDKCRYAKCVVCQNHIQCLECLSIGKEYDCHTYDHEFIIVEPESDPILCADWGGDEEILLLSLVKRLGFGNWEDISDLMEYRSPIECEQHYFDVYMNSKNVPLPEDCIHDPFPPSVPPPFDTTPKESNPIEGSTLDLTKKNKKRKTTLAEFCGYMPYRHEFEEYYHKDAEKLICNLQFDQKKETQETFIMKIQNLICYNSQVAERQLRTKTIEQFDIAHIELTSETEKDLAIMPLHGFYEEDKCVDRTILPLGQYIGAPDTIKFAELIHKRAHLERKIMMREFCISQGIDDIQDLSLFQRLKKNVKKGKIINIKGWNEEISKLGESVSTNYDFKLLSKTEKEFCIDNKIDAQLFMAIKSLILREFEVRGRLRKDDLIKMSDSVTLQNQMCLAYDFFKSIGLLSL